MPAVLPAAFRVQTNDERGVRDAEFCWASRQTGSAGFGVPFRGRVLVLYLTSQKAEAGWASLYSASHWLNCCVENESE
eukprot:6089532-Amphidinium_carterae.1